MLKDIPFHIVYSSGENEPVEFFFDALLESTSFDLGLGYFSSSAINVLSAGFAYFIHRGGKMRIIINDFLSSEDKKAIEKGINEPKDKFEENILDDIQKLFKTLSKRDKHFFNCMSFLIANKRMEFIATIPKNNHGGIAHSKYGIFRDEYNNKVVFNGSVNFSKNALLNNIESISCYKSWSNEESEINRLLYFESVFNKIWLGESENNIIIPIEKVKTIITEKFPISEIEELIENENILLQEVLNTPSLSKSFKKKVLTTLKKFNYSKPRFLVPSQIKIRPYQEIAYKKWCENGFSGIFAMATGTGKTITSIYCAYREYVKGTDINSNTNLHLLIIVPTQPLLKQWEQELSQWKCYPIYVVSGETNWRKELQEIVNDFSFGIDSSYAIISTYRSFSNTHFQRILNQLPDDTILIADEAHNMGQRQVKELLPSIKLTKRIGLSATPKRIYDPEGSFELETFFNDSEPYCFSIYLDQAIREGNLCRYEYFPKIVELEPDELKDYIEISKKIAQFAKNSKSNSNELDSIYEMLLLKRKRIINKAKGKFQTLRKIINEINKKEELKYCFTYAPAGEIDGVDLITEQDNKRIIREMQRIFEEESPNIRTHSYLGETNARDEVLKGFELGEIDVLLAINCLDEGIDVPRTSIGIFTSSTGNPRQFIQRRGRVLRKHKDKGRALLYDMIVIPKIFDSGNNDKFFKIQRNLVKNELMRVGYFAKLSENYYDAKEELSDICKYYELDLDTIIKELEE